MANFQIGDRVTDGKQIGRVIKIHPTSLGGTSICVEFKGWAQCFAPDSLRPAWQTCKDCDGKGRIIPADRSVWCLDCGTCLGTGRVERLGPYRLRDNTWSDGVERMTRIRSFVYFRKNPNRWSVLSIGTGVFEAYVADKGDGGALLVERQTLAEAIAYADKVARKGSA